MRSYASKPSSDAGLRPIQDFLPQVVDLVSYRRHSATARDATPTAREVQGRHAEALPASKRGGVRLTAKQMASACQAMLLTGRGSAPSGAPGSTQVRTGGEGSPSREVVACAAGVPTHGEAASLVRGAVFARRA